jgi:hypothetical protein
MQRTACQPALRQGGIQRRMAEGVRAVRGGKTAPFQGGDSGAKGCHRVCKAGGGLRHE